MEITLLSKARFDALMQDIKNLETQIAMANSQLRAMQESNNTLAEIAFDENKFTQQLMDKVWDHAAEAAKEAVDLDDVAEEVNDRLDISDDVHRVIERMDLQTADEVNDKIESYICDNSILNSSEVEEAISDYIEMNCDFVDKGDVEDMIDERVNEAVDERTEEIARRIAQEEIKKALVAFAHEMMHAAVGTNNLIVKENHNATDSHQTNYSLQVSGTNGHGESSSHVQPNA